MKCSKCGIPTFGPLCMYCKGEAIRPTAMPVTSHPMTTNPKPLLTRIKVEQERKALADMDSKFGGTLEVDCYVRKQTAMLNTIDRMAELLEQWLQVNQVSSHGVVKATHDLLKTFNATGGEGS